MHVALRQTFKKSTWSFFRVETPKLNSYSDFNLMSEIRKKKAWYYFCQNTLSAVFFISSPESTWVKLTSPENSSTKQENYKHVTSWEQESHCKITSGICKQLRAEKRRLLCNLPITGTQHTVTMLSANYISLSLFGAVAETIPLPDGDRWGQHRGLKLWDMYGLKTKRNSQKIKKKKNHASPLNWTEMFGTLL